MKARTARRVIAAAGLLVAMHAALHHAMARGGVAHVLLGAGHGMPSAGAALLAALFVAGYATVFVETARRILADEDRDAVATAHRAALDRLFRALRHGVASAT